MKVIGAAAVALTLMSPSAFALEILDATTPHKLLPALQKFGTAEMSSDDTGDPLVKGSMEGINYLVFFYGCTNNSGCRNVTFMAGWNADGISQDTINEWNRTKRFGKAFIDEEGDPAIQMSVNLDFGVTAENFEDTVDWWRVVITDFRDNLVDKK